MESEARMKTKPKDPEVNLSENSPEEIWISTDLTDKVAIETRSKLLRQAARYPKLPIILYVNSYGGNLDALTVLIDTIEELKEKHKVITVCVGKAMSAGAVILASGTERYVAKSSRVMIHQAAMGMSGTSSEISVGAAELERQNIWMIQTLKKYSKKHSKMIQALLDSNVDINLSPKDAIQLGLADKIGIPRIELIQEYRVVVG
jgi:ATP-dependent Clp protease, protease subunit